VDVSSCRKAGVEVGDALSGRRPRHLGHDRKPVDVRIRCEGDAGYGIGPRRADDYTLRASRVPWRFGSRAGVVG